MITHAPTRESYNFDNTRLSAYKKCPRFYLIRHVLGWRKEGNAPALAFGGAWHEGMDVVWRHAREHSPEQLAEMAFQAFCIKFESEGFNIQLSIEDENLMQPRTPGNAHEMYFNYINARWSMLQEAVLIAAEQPFAVPMPELEDTWYIGRLDKVISYNDTRPVILEHKTTSYYSKATNFRSDYVDSWFASSQVKGYEFAGHLMYEDISAVWVDAALVHKTVHDAFKFIPVAHSQPLLFEWADDTREWAIRVKAETESVHMFKKLLPGVFPRNEDSCFGKYGVCPFLDICRTVSDPTTLEEPPEGYIREVWEPFDVLELDKLKDEE